MSAIAWSTNPEIFIASSTAQVIAVYKIIIHVKMSLHMRIIKVHHLMLENRVREIRVKQKMTQAELALAIDVSRQTIHSIENKKVIPTVEIAIKIGKTLKTKIEKLFFVSKK